jgi:His/Glu/Gln/Arg/opine family amino acid ABC transporter permease subunit
MDALETGALLAAYEFDFSWLAPAIPELLRGLWVTISLTVTVMVLSLPLGLGVAFARRSRFGPIRWVAYAYTELFRTTPLLVQIFFTFFALPVLIGVNFDSFTAAVIAFTLNVGAFLAEIFRGSINTIDRGQREAAISTGMSERQSMRRVVLPQALRRSVPLVAAIWISLFKDTSLVSLVGLKDLAGEGATIYRETFRQIEVMAFLAVMYFALTYPQAIIINKLFEKFRVRE